MSPGSCLALALILLLRLAGNSGAFGEHRVLSPFFLAWLPYLDSDAGHLRAFASAALVVLRQHLLCPGHASIALAAAAWRRRLLSATHTPVMAES